MSSPVALTVWSFRCETINNSIYLYSYSSCLVLIPVFLYFYTFYWRSASRFVFSPRTTSERLRPAAVSPGQVCRDPTLPKCFETKSLTANTTVEFDQVNWLSAAVFRQLRPARLSSLQDWAVLRHSRCSGAPQTPYLESEVGKRGGIPAIVNILEDFYSLWPFIYSVLGNFLESGSFHLAVRRRRFLEAEVRIRGFKFWFAARGSLIGFKTGPPLGRAEEDYAADFSANWCKMKKSFIS